MYKALVVSVVFLALACYYQFRSQSPIAHTTQIVDSMSLSRHVIKRVLAVEQSEGAGARVRRSIGSMALKNLSPFLMLDHFTVGKGAGFPDHPHRGQATVTYMTHGSFRHEDSAGHRGEIAAGGVQWMCAGKGIIHAEMPVHGHGLPEPQGLQLWVDLPKEYKMIEPSYQELDPSGIPSAYPEGPDGPVQIRVISGKSHGVESPVRPQGGCWYFHVIFKKKSSIFQDIPVGWTSFMYILKGKLRVNPGTNTLEEEPYHTLVLSRGQNETGVAIQSTEDETELIVISGEPLNQGVVQYGPFVMTTKDEIDQTILDYRMSRNGFEKAHTWQSEIGN